MFPALGLQPALGRLIGPQDAAGGAAPVAVVSWSYWKTRFNLDPKVVGATIKINGTVATIVGVTPRAFIGLQPGVMPAIYVPVTRPMGLGLLARLKPGVTIEQARAEMTVLQQPRLEELAKRSGDPKWLQSKMFLEPAGAGFSALRDRFATPLRILMMVVGLILLIACTNVASLVLARGAARRHEMAVRVSLGAGRLRLTRQVLTESLLLSTAGSVLGLVIGYVGAEVLVRTITGGGGPLGWPRHLDLQLTPDLHVLLFIAGLALATGVMFGLAPAWSAFTSAPITALRETGSATERKSRRLFGQGLVVAQVALSVVLLTAAGLLIGHLSDLRNLNLGFQRDSVLIVNLNPQGSGLNRMQLTRLYRELLDRLHAIPGVRSAALAAVTPIAGGAASRFATVEGYQEHPESRRRLWENWVGPKYFETLGTPLVAGREFQFEDAGHPRVAIVNQTMARRYFGDASPLGRHFTFEHETVPFEIVGVAVDAKYADLHDAAPSTVYLNAFQEQGVASTFALRTRGAPTAVVPDVRRALKEVLPNVRVGTVTTLTDQVDASLLQERVLATLSTLFGALGASLAAMGLYGLLAYTVARRTSEIGVRMALGATQRDVTRMILKSALALVVVGLVAGATVALWTRRVAAGMIDNLHATTGLPIVIAALAMIAVGLLAAYVPARRAARVNPVDALRHS